jgi:8-amino-7-oxononanoate synthase
MTLERIPPVIHQKLADRIQQKALRVLPSCRSKIDFFSNDYLGLASSLELAILIENKSSRLDGSKFVNGASGSRLISGNLPIMEQVEFYLAQFFQASSCLIFNSGYNANLSILSSIPQKGDTILSDQLIHASLIDSARLSFAKRLSFKHNDTSDLERKLQLAEGQKYVVVESIYSMDGDESPLEAILTLCEKYQAYLIVDEAHSTGVKGELGRGVCIDKNIHERVFARIYTFGKAMGIHGACVCGSSQLKNYLVNFARPFIYSTAMSPISYIAIESAFEYLQSLPELIHQLNQNIAYFKKCWQQNLGAYSHYLLPSDSAIQIISTPGIDFAKSIANQLQKFDIEAKAILSPTVPAGQERIRLCMHAFNTQEEIEQLTKALQEVFCSN